MLDFERVKKKIDSMSEKELNQAIAFALKESHIAFKMKDNKVVIDEEANLPSLEKLREEIDDIDEELQAILERRMNVVAAIAKKKSMSNSVGIYDPKREERCIKRIVGMTNLRFRNGILNIYKKVLEESKNFQREYIEGLKKR